MTLVSASPSTAQKNKSTLFSEVIDTHGKNKSNYDSDNDSIVSTSPSTTRKNK